MKIKLIIMVSWMSLAHQGFMYGAACSRQPLSAVTENGISILDYSNMVFPQQGVDCGLHALKNSIVLFNYLTGIIDVQERNRQLQSEALGHIPSMNACRLRLGGSAGLLETQDILDLAQQLEYPFDVPVKNNKLLILYNLNRQENLDSQIRTTQQNKQLAGLIEDIASGVPFVHAFVLGNMDEVQASSGHWIGAVLARDDQGGPLVLHMANSILSGFDSDVAMGTMLINFLSALCVEDLRYGVIRALSGSFERNLDDNHFEAAIKNVRDILEEVNEQGVANVPAFREQALMLMQRLESIPEAFLTEDILNQKIGLTASLAEFTMQLPDGSRTQEAQRAALSCPIQRLAVARVLAQRRMQKTESAAASLSTQPVLVQAQELETIVPPVVQVPVPVGLSNDELTRIQRRISSGAGSIIKADSALMSRIQASASANNQIAKNILTKLRNVNVVATRPRAVRPRAQAPVRRAAPVKRSVPVRVQPVRRPAVRPANRAVQGDAARRRMYNRTSSQAVRRRKA
jgi:hypothetical protein